MQHSKETSGQNLWPLVIGAIGVVYGDIGTSPLYAFREAVAHVTQDGAILPREVLGILSLILWSMTLIVTVKYVSILLKIDNNGEGGTLALMALARTVIYRNTTFFLYLGIAGAALFYGDAIITPAISVLSAVEGIKLVTPALENFVVPVSAMIIVALFVFQSSGTAGVSKLFGPLTVVWFAVMGLMGAAEIMRNPSVLWALSPYYALEFMFSHGMLSFITLGAVFLAVTGAEALYADLGHFGRRPIQLAWGWFVFPSLALNYLGQGALVLRDPAALANPFYLMVPEKMLPFLVMLATAATVVASQAVITGAYSLTRQAVNLGLFPRLVIRHTSADHSGQIYMPQVNYLMMIGVLLLVFMFRSSGALAAAYGISVTGTMVVTAIMVFFVLWQIRNWPLWAAIAVVGPFLLIDGVFLTANLMKLWDGGWMPLLLAAVMSTVMLTWISGTFIISGRARRRDVKLDRFVRDRAKWTEGAARVGGTAFFLSADPNVVPPALLQNLRHNKVLHAQNIILSIRIEPVPHVPAADRFVLTRLGGDMSVLVLRFGFKDDMDVQAELLRLNRDSVLDFDWEDTSLFISRKSIRSHARYGLSVWQGWIYVFLNKHASEPADFYKLPFSRVIEIGRQVVI